MPTTPKSPPAHGPKVPYTQKIGEGDSPGI